MEGSGKGGGGETRPDPEARNQERPGASSPGGAEAEGRPPVVVDEESLERLGTQIKEVMRRAMRDFLQEQVSKGEYDHVLRLWKEVRERLLRLSGTQAEREKTLAAIDCEYAQELVGANALDNSIFADMVQLCSQRLAHLGAVAYERQVLAWGLKLANELRGEGEKPRSPAEILATFFDASDTLLTRIEAGVAAHLLCQAMASHPGLRAQPPQA